MQHYGLTLALRDAPTLIARYKVEHRNAWPDVIRRLREIGITEMKIFLLGRRLFMYMETVDDFDPARAFQKLTDDARYRQWDALMRTMQERVPEAREGEWWAHMEEVFDLNWPGGRAPGG